MKKVLAIIIVTVMCLALMCGCGGDDKGDTTTTNVANAGVTIAQGGVQTPATNAAVNNNVNVDATNGQVSGNQPVADGLEGIVAKYVDLGKYNIEPYEDKWIDFELKEDTRNNFTLGVEFGTKSFNNIPCTYADVVAAGFELDGDADAMVQSYDTLFCDFWDDNTKAADFAFYNYADAECKALETTLFSVDVSAFYLEQGKSVNICGVTGTSNINDLIKTMGTPYAINAEENEEGTFIEFDFVDSGSNYVAVTIDANTNTIVDIYLGVA